MKSDCKNCKSEGTCLDEPMEDCKDYRETDEARKSRIEAEVKAHKEIVLREFAELMKAIANAYYEEEISEEEEIRADERAKVLKEVSDIISGTFANDSMKIMSLKRWIKEFITEYEKENEER